MDARLRNITIAIILAIIGSLLLSSYLNSLQAKIDEGAKLASVFVAKSPVSAGASGEDLMMIMEKRDIPQKYVAADAIKSESDVKDKSLVIALSAGEQLTKNKLRQEAVSEISYRLTSGKVAVSIPVDEVIGVSGNVKAGDHVAIFATFTPGPGGSDITQLLLGDIEVLMNSEGDVKSGKLSSSGGLKKTLTLAVTLQEAEKVIFAEEKGKVWVSLLPANREGVQINSTGQTMETVFR